MNLSKLTLAALLPVCFLTSCAQYDDKRVSDRAAIEAEAAEKKKVAIENENLNTRAMAMELDLEKRVRFYEAVSGTYRGQIKLGTDETYEVELIVVPTRAVLNTGRVRTIDEVTHDLNNLSLNIQAKQWNPNLRIGATGFVYGEVLPDIAKGTISISNPDCPVFYLLRIDESPVQILSGEVKSAQRLFGVMQSVKLSRPIEIELHRTGSNQ